MYDMYLFEFNNLNDASQYKKNLFIDFEEANKHLDEGYIKVGFGYLINDSGEYQVRVKAYRKGDSTSFEEGVVSEYSPIFTYVRPSLELNPPSGLTWESSNPLIAKWNAVENAETYGVFIYKDDVLSHRIGTQETSIDLSRYVVKGDHCLKSCEASRGAVIGRTTCIIMN